MFKQKYSKKVYDFINDNIEKRGLEKEIKNIFGIVFSKGALEYYRRKHKGIKVKRAKIIPSFFKKPVGTERVDKDGYVRIIVEEGKEKLKHHIVWEENNPPIKKDECLLFLDGNKQNCSIDNLFLFKRKYVSTLNYMTKNIENITPEQRKSLILCAILKVEANEKKLKLKSKNNNRKPKGTTYIIVRDLYNQGLLPSQIAKVLNKNINVIHWTLRRLKLGCYDD